MYDIWRNPAAQRYSNRLRLEIGDSGYARLDSVWCYHDVCSPFSRLYIVRKGEGVVVDRGQRMPLLPGYVYLIPASMTFDHWCDEYLEKLYFHLNLLLSDGSDLFARHGQILKHPLSMERMDEMISLYRSGSGEDAVRLQAQVYSLLLDMVAENRLSALAAKSYSPAISRLFPILQRDLSSKLTVHALAQQLNMSESTLSKRFRAEVGVTLGSYIDSLLLQKAKQMLITGEQSIGEIAEELRFCDQFYFSRYFRQRQGMTPSEYRRQQKHLT